MNKFIGSLGCLTIFVIVFIGVGWLKNIYEIVNLDFAPPYKAEIFRSGALIIFPLAGVVGWLNIEDGQVENIDAPNRP